MAVAAAHRLYSAITLVREGRVLFEHVETEELQHRPGGEAEQMAEQVQRPESEDDGRQPSPAMAGDEDAPRDEPRSNRDEDEDPEQ